MSKQHIKTVREFKVAAWAIERIAELEEAREEYAMLKDQFDKLNTLYATSKKDALEDAANKFDGTTGYNWTAADGYANAFDIACELRYMATEVSNARVKAAAEGSPATEGSEP